MVDANTAHRVDGDRNVRTREEWSVFIAEDTSDPRRVQRVAGLASAEVHVYSAYLRSACLVSCGQKIASVKSKWLLAFRGEQVKSA